MAERGVRAEPVKPVFPSKTLPNRDTMMTRLHPGYHGIIEGWIHVPSLSPNFVDVRRKTHLSTIFYTNDPGQLIAAKLGSDVSCLYYPGCYHYPYHRPDADRDLRKCPNGACV
ncbi:unnamed protein product, partial [Mesorhabditis belari]|uniref:Uncharacterized protein n=1 Tax=Mesorhabditis belari TaxID=2138241 RepID=A0AAF3EDR8_9BILA